MINNFAQIKTLLDFPNNDIYYHLQIIRRGKDHPELPAANRMIKAYFICKLESLDHLEQEIINLCEQFKARAYINLTPKSIKKTTLLQMKYLAQRVYDNDYQKIWKSWDTCAGEIKGEKSRWVVDLDNYKLEDIPIIIQVINKIDPVGPKCVATIPTKSGFHLITHPFNIQKFKDYYTDIDVHKNNPTLLYCL